MIVAQLAGIFNCWGHKSIHRAKEKRTIPSMHLKMSKANSKAPTVPLKKALISKVALKMSKAETGEGQAQELIVRVS